MNTDPKQDYQLLHLEHTLRIAQADRGYVADQAAALRGRHPVASAIGKRVGHAMVVVGERLQGAPHRTTAEPAGTLQPQGRA